MKKIAVMLFLSFLVGMVNASEMPVVSATSSNASQSAAHSHCDEAINTANEEDSATAGKLSLAHYCCSALAVLGEPIAFISLGSPSFYLLGEISKPTSNITESIYKPPKLYL